MRLFVDETNKQKKSRLSFSVSKFIHFSHIVVSFENLFNNLKKCYEGRDKNI